MTVSEDRDWRVVLRHPWFRPTVVVLASLLIGWFILRFVGKVSWSAVGDAIRSVSVWELIALIGLLLLRQSFNAVPISRFTPGLGLPRSVVSDLSANLAGTIAPPPGDVVIRVAQFRTWGINPVDGMAGATLNMLIFYGARFAAPALGAVIFCVYSFDTGKALTGVVCLLIAALIIGVLVSVLRSDAVAERLARRAARAVAAMKADVDEQRWIDATVDFRRRIGKTLNHGLGPALAFMVLGIVVDAAIVLASVRFVGLGADIAPWPVVIGATLLAYPLTILPAFGLGVMDAVVIASIADVAGHEHESTLVAATILWRTITIFGTLGLGALAMAWWRTSVRRGGKAAAASGTNESS